MRISASGVAEERDGGRLRAGFDAGEAFIGQLVDEGGFAHLEPTDDGDAVEVWNLGKGESLVERLDLLVEIGAVAGKLVGLGFGQFFAERNGAIANLKQGMPDVYISRAGLDSKAADEKFQQTELGALKDELSKVEQAAKIKDERIALLESSQSQMNERIALLAQVLALSPSALETKAALIAQTNHT